MTTKEALDYHTLIVRVDPEQARKLKLIAAYESDSMANLVRVSLGEIVTDREQKKAYRDLFNA